MAPAIFYLRGISPPEITLMHMYKGVVLFILLHGVVLAFVLAIPDLALGYRQYSSEVSDE